MKALVLVAGNTVPSIALERGDYARWIREGTGDAWPGTWAAHDLREPSPLPRPHDADAFVITGSSSSVTERAAWMLRGEELVRAIADAAVPLLGICFGHQMIAQALGGQVRRNPRGREIGTLRLERLADDPLFGGLPRVFDVNGTHVDAVAELPPRAEVLATTSLDPAAAFRVGRTIRAVQFHPEFDAHVMRGYLRARAELVRGEGLDPEALLAAVHEGTRGGDILRNFARMAAGRGGHLRRGPAAPRRAPTW
ncbi:MAG: glutamine amidotransferase [Polyangiaceae bacterium]